MSLFQWGSFTLHSGDKSWWRIDCDDFTQSEIALLAKLIIEKDGKPFCVAIAPLSHPGSAAPRLAEEINKFSSHNSGDGAIVVDDVLTTGNSMWEVFDKIKTSYNQENIRGAVIFARGKPPTWVTALFSFGE